MPLTAARPLFSRLALFSVEDGGPAQRGIMDLRDIGTRRRASLLLLPTLPLLLPPPPAAVDGFEDDGRGGGFACAPARVCRRGLTGMVGGVFPCDLMMLEGMDLSFSTHTTLYYCSYSLFPQSLLKGWRGHNFSWRLQRRTK
jgi:hypothetical protein